jgi:hypothetical protein
MNCYSRSMIKAIMPSRDYNVSQRAGKVRGSHRRFPHQPHHQVCGQRGHMSHRAQVMISFISFFFGKGSRGGGGRGLCTSMVHLCVLSECLRHSLTPQCCKQRSNRFLETASACPHTSHPASTLTSATLARRVHRNTTA